MTKTFSPLILLFVFGCTETKPPQAHTGFALGTKYAIQYNGINMSFDEVQNGIDSLFTVINESMSTYIPNSDISKINSGDSLLQVDAHFIKVFEKATEVWKATDGFFDPTVGVWVNAYGFGPDKLIKTLTQEKKAYLSKITGWHTIELTGDNTIKKSYLETYLDFNALAKGYAVDVLADYLSKSGSSNYLVEIGGEIVAYGNSPKTNLPWIIAIDDPKQQNERKMIQRLSLNNEAIATSGNYRKFRVDVETGERYVHSINPLTGIPVKSNVLSASVRAADCMTADGFATAFQAMGIESATRFLEAHQELKAYFIYEDENKVLQTLSLNGFPE